MEWLILTIIGLCVWLHVKIKKLDVWMDNTPFWEPKSLTKYKPQPPKEEKVKQDFFMRE